QGDDTAEVEGELRWQFHPRFSLVGFAGTGVARSGVVQSDREQTASAWGGGFRYLVAREYGLQMGLDLAQGPDGPIWYVVFGHAWIRP
ncbi:MAG TPA: glyceraldehyde-3-phosphate dehydrogenase, partial [Burkholderiales bacterium]